MFLIESFRVVNCIYLFRYIESSHISKIKTSLDHDKWSVGCDIDWFASHLLRIFLSEWLAYNSIVRGGGRSENSSRRSQDIQSRARRRVYWCCQFACSPIVCSLCSYEGHCPAPEQVLPMSEVGLPSPTIHLRQPSHPQVTLQAKPNRGRESLT